MRDVVAFLPNQQAFRKGKVKYIHK